MKAQLTKIAFAAFLTTGLLTACSKDDDIVEENHEEVITTLKLTFTPVGGGTATNFQFRDPDGPGGAAPTQDEIVLAPSKTYTVAVQLLNETHTPAEDITEEVEAEADAHRFYYQPSAGSNITVNNLNNDANGIPLGLTSTWTTAAAANGTVKITLRHYPGNPPAKAAADAVDSNKSGTDVEVTFVAKVQ
ncbi:hypothetical protein LZZ85_20625 [Terrimonas sp. NA20]|uniref:Type 1 periplasmic binding fold superfamily protein n=1 Tax=Terrimonas ginsenosidimutans TaxID=2908004 RepID=A0ABS9KWJ4_9BACT|nr:hypothetical protein [Terrimonas ginsenosidimutans]MCG2616716.1 hypothetical protein [Terrimonas ginsenosidimutans]